MPTLAGPMLNAHPHPSQPMTIAPRTRLDPQQSHLAPALPRVLGPVAAPLPREPKRWRQTWPPVRECPASPRHNRQRPHNSSPFRCSRPNSLRR